MKLLLDTCVWGGAKKTLVSSGHDVVWTGDWSQDPGDEEILAKANKVLFACPLYSVFYHRDAESAEIKFFCLDF